MVKKEGLADNLFELGSAIWDLARFSGTVYSLKNTPKNIGEAEFRAMSRWVFREKLLRVGRGSERLLWGSIDAVFQSSALLIHVCDQVLPV